MSQTEAARLLNVTQSMVCNWERGQCYPRTSRLKDIAQLYQCSVDDLLKQYKVIIRPQK